MIQNQKTSVDVLERTLGHCREEEGQIGREGELRHCKRQSVRRDLFWLGGEKAKEEAQASNLPWRRGSWLKGHACHALIKLSHAGWRRWRKASPWLRWRRTSIGGRGLKGTTRGTLGWRHKATTCWWRRPELARRRRLESAHGRYDEKSCLCQYLHTLWRWGCRLMTVAVAVVGHRRESKRREAAKDDQKVWLSILIWLNYSMQCVGSPVRPSSSYWESTSNLKSCLSHYRLYLSVLSKLEIFRVVAFALRCWPF